jgi:tRNA(Ile)-lysidine synthase
MTPRGLDDAPVVAVACSGGRDSIALLHATIAAARSCGLSVAALHVHHGLMPGADAWAAGVEDFCRRHGAGFRCTRLSSAPAAGDSVEAWARRERYAALARMARDAGATLVLLGHHRRDQAETVLLQALRGAGPAGLAAMPWRVDRDGLTWARPWLDQPAAAIDDYVAAARLEFVVDPSNGDPRFARNRLRAAVMPALSEAFPQAEAALAAAARRAHEARSVLDEVAEEDLARLGATDVLPLAPWRAMSAPRRANVLRRWLASRAASPVPETLLQRVLAEAVDDAPRRWPLDDARLLRAWRGQLAVVARALPPSQARGASALRLLRCDAYAIDGWSGTLQVFATEREGVSPLRLAHVVARTRAGGEQFQRRPGGMPRSLKKQFQDAGVPEEARGGPLLFDADGALLFVPALGVDARAWAEEGAPQWALRWLPCAAEEG